MTIAETRRRTVIAGTNPHTGSPIKLRKRNKPKNTAAGPKRSPQSSLKKTITKQKVKASKEHKSILICNGRLIDIPEPTVVPRRLVEPRPLQQGNVATSDHVSASIPGDESSSMADEDGLMDDMSFQQETAPGPQKDAHQDAWLHQLPKFDGSQRHRRTQAWPRWRNEVLHAVAPRFLEAEAMIYNRISLPTPQPPIHSTASPLCSAGDCQLTMTSTVVQCVDRTIIHHYNVEHCPSLTCFASLAAILVKCGYFPCTPTRCKTAFSFEILESYLSISVQSSFSPSIFRLALLNGLQQRRYALEGIDPWKNQFPDAVLWFDALKRLLEVKFSQLVNKAEQTFLQSQSDDEPPALACQGPLAAYILRKRCSLCFGRRTWGGDPESNPDVLVCIDACFQHRRYSNVPDDPEILQPGDSFMFLSEDKVAAAKRHCEDQRNNNKQSTRQDARVPSGSLDECRDSHNAATNKGNQESDNLYASKANMNMVCRHDKPLFACDVRTPGEQRFYAIALIEALAECLPANASIGILYDIACQLDRSIAKHDLIPHIAPRLSCATALFHAYAHQISCQWVYHPRRRTGFGWTNGEGNERNWALARDTISQERIMGPHRRLFFLSRKYEYIASLKNQKVGDWMERKRMDIKKAKIEAETYLKDLRPGWTTEHLREEYAILQRTQLSVRAYNAQVASRNLATLIDSQRSADSLTMALDALNKELDNYEYQQRMLGTDCRDVRHLYDAANELQIHHQESIQQLQELTANLGLLQIQLPVTVEDQDKPFLKQMILIHTLKTSLWTRLQRLQDEMTPIRESATRSGVGSSLGTKRLQGVVRTVQNRGKSILSTVDAYNKLIDDLSTLPLPQWFNPSNIPAKLEKRGLLDIGPEAEIWEDIAMSHVWFTLFGRHFEDAPAYVRDPKVRKGIQMVLQLDRIAEEEKRLQAEDENMLVEFNFEFLALHFALMGKESNNVLAFRIQQRMEWLLQHRHYFIKGKNRPNIALWRLHPNDVMAFAHDNADISPLLQTVSSFQCRHSAYLRDLSLCEPCHTLPEDISLSESFDIFQQESPVTGSSNASFDVVAHEEDDDPETTVSADLIELTNDIHNLSVGHNDDPQIRLPAFEEAHTLVVTNNNNARHLYRQRHPSALPSIRTLFEVLNADQQRMAPNDVLQNSYSQVCTAVSRSMTRAVAPRVPMDLTDRFCKDFVVAASELKSLDANRHLKMRVVAAYCRLVKNHYEEHVLAHFLPPDQRPNVWIIDPGCLDIGPEVMLYHFIDEEGKIRHDRFTKDAWLFPWYSSVRCTWILGIVDWKRRKFWYCDSRPLCVKDKLREGDAHMWHRLRRFTAVACALAGISEDVFSWGLGRASLSDRLMRRTDSGLWVLADIEAWHTGQLHADRKTDMDAYRLVVRQAVLSLPHATPEQSDSVPPKPDATRYIHWRDKLRTLKRERPWLLLGLPAGVNTKASTENPLNLDEFWDRCDLPDLEQLGVRYTPVIITDYSRITTE